MCNIKLAKILRKHNKVTYFVHNYYDLHSNTRGFNVGDKVLVKVEPFRTKFGPRFDGPFEITQKRGNVNYKIKKPNEWRNRVVHVNKLKPYYM